MVSARIGWKVQDAFVVLDQALARMNVCDIETIGRVSGRLHVVELWFAADPQRHRVYMLSGRRDDSDWVKNLRRNSHARIRLGGRWLSGKAADIEGEADDPLARRLLAAKYQGWTEGKPLSSWARNSLPIVLDLDS